MKGITIRALSRGWATPAGIKIFFDLKPTRSSPAVQGVNTQQEDSELYCIYNLSNLEIADK